MLALPILLMLLRVIKEKVLCGALAFGIRSYTLACQELILSRPLRMLQLLKPVPVYLPMLPMAIGILWNHPMFLVNRLTVTEACRLLVLSHHLRTEHLENYFII
jgi:hypothetical protein